MGIETMLLDDRANHCEFFRGHKVHDLDTTLAVATIHFCQEIAHLLGDRPGMLAVCIEAKIRLVARDCTVSFDADLEHIYAVEKAFKTGQATRSGVKPGLC